jgi:hypothetical protein
METGEDRQMSNEMSKQSSALVNYNPGKATLLEMRADSTRFPRIKTMPREQAVMGMAKIVSQAFLYRGQAADPTNIQFISSALVQELLDDDKYGAGYLSLAEIQVVVKRAVLGGSEMFGISVASLYKVIIAFCKNEGHLNQTMVNMSRRKEAQQPTAASVRLQAAAGNFIKNHTTK